MTVAFNDGVISLAVERDALYIAEKIKAAGGTFIAPTDAQSAIITSKHWGPALVTAGAGSGKTETMSQRVLWLVTNGIVEPSEILGLTFTRKAAGELSTRIRKRLRQLQSVHALPKSSETGLPLDLTVDVSTYHSYAGRVLGEHGIRLGIDAQTAPLGEAAAWMLDQNLVLNFDRREYELKNESDWVIGKLQSLTSAIGEHGVTIEDVRKLARASLEKFEAIPDPLNDNVRKAIKALRDRLEILYMVEESIALRKAEGRFSFDDQMSFAAQLVNELPDVGEIERGKYKVVLLDEYQDTSQSQIRFLSGLFGDGHPVTAVGDPNQAIYGWRGASAGTMKQFANDFKGKVEVKEFELLTSWRNDQRILDFSNAIVAAAGEKFGTSFSVKELKARATAGEGELKCGRYLTRMDEAQAIADFIAAKWFDPAYEVTGRPTFSVLVRAKKYIQEIENALRERAIPTEVVGLAGLIHIPEIAEIIALLRSATDPNAGTALARILVGPRLAVGAKDLRALGRFARSLTDSSQLGRSTTLEKILAGGAPSTMEGDDFAVGSIIEALDRVHEAKVGTFSAEGLLRLSEFSADLQEFRRNLGGSVVDAVIEAERFLRLDVEVLVRDGWKHGRRHLDKFLDEAASFQRNGGSLFTFLDWLKVADKQERGLQPTSVVESHEAVQILTVHGAKGAEWDYVIIPGLIEKNFPGDEKESADPMRNAGEIPLSLRGDRNQLGFDFEMPNLEEKKAATRVGKALEESKERWGRLHDAEEYRLAYVAFTRARHGIFATSTHFSGGKRAVGAGWFYDLLENFLQERDATSILHSEDLEALQANGEALTNPDLLNAKQAEWPKKLAITEKIQASAELVSRAAALAEDYIAENESEASLLRDADLLLREIANRRQAEVVYLPARLSVSTMISLKKEPEALALNLRRPMPNYANPFARKGTQFHEWIEKYFGQSTLFDDDSLDPFGAPSKDEKVLAELKNLWLTSDWAKLTPWEVESGFETVLAGVVIKGRIDAVYRSKDESGDYLYEVVDWKTGRELEGEELDNAAIQLAMYRLAYSKLHNIPLERISAAFFYIPAKKTIRPVDILGENELLAIISAIPN